MSSPAPPYRCRIRLCNHHSLRHSRRPHYISIEEDLVVAVLAVDRPGRFIIVDLQSVVAATAVYDGRKALIGPWAGLEIIDDDIIIAV